MKRSDFIKSLVAIPAIPKLLESEEVELVSNPKLFIFRFAGVLNQYERRQILDTWKRVFGEDTPHKVIVLDDSVDLTITDLSLSGDVQDDDTFKFVMPHIKP